MTDLATLQQDIRQLKDIESIKVLKARYIRSMTLSDWDAMASLLTEDVESAYSDGKYTFSGRDELVSFLREANQTGYDQVSWWIVGMPEISFQGDDRATAIWGLLHFHLNKEEHYHVDQFSYYEDEYVRQDGRWLIRKTGYKRVLEEQFDRRSLLESFQREVG